MVGADAVAHGATGKGNDQVRFELSYYANKPDIKIIAPWREWDLLSREKLLKYAEDAGIEIDMKHKKGGAPYSMDANLLQISLKQTHNPNEIIDQLTCNHIFLNKNLVQSDLTSSY
jgi:argininosuccinate synthase